MVTSNKPKSPRKSKPKATPEVPADPELPDGQKDYQWCSFCGRDKLEVEFLIGGIDAAICERCLDESRDIIGAARIRKRDETDAAR